jgi:hypothetical protein
MRREIHRLSYALLAALGVGGVLGCSSHEEDVCENVGNCAHAGSSDWVQACQDEAKSLSKEASAVGCGSAFDDYFACADSNFTCHGITATSPGCEAKLATLDQCLASATAKTSCVMLQAKQAACPGSRDAGAEAGVPPACTSGRDCEAHCFLSQVADVCAPELGELSNFVSCAASCPP